MIREQGMALDSEQQIPDTESRSTLDCLRECSSLAGIDDAALIMLASEAAHFSLPAACALFNEADAADGCYVLASGRLGVKDPVSGAWANSIGRGEIVGESGWLLGAPRSATVIALRDSELIWLPSAVLNRTAQQFPALGLAAARLCAQRLRRLHRHERPMAHARLFALVPNSSDIDLAGFARGLLTELSRFGRAELVWDVHAHSHTSAWFDRIAESNDYVIYVADASPSAWTHQCCRQADSLLLLARADRRPSPWPHELAFGQTPIAARKELVLLHSGRLLAGAAARWLEHTTVNGHHHVVTDSDIARVARLASQRGIGLVLSGGGARGFAHIGVLQALREQSIEVDFLGGASIGAIMAAGAALGWNDAQMRERYQRSFVATNPVNDYTFPLVALARGRKVTRLLQREFGDVSIEDMPRPFFCVSANLNSGRICEHRSGPLWQALRACVAIPGVLPPVFRGDDVLVDGAAINNLPVDMMQMHRPGYVIGVDVGADRSFTARASVPAGPPLWRIFSRSRSGRRRINIFQILFRAGMINSATTALAQRTLADVLIIPALENIDLLDWKAFDKAIHAGYLSTRRQIDEIVKLEPHRGQQLRARSATRVGLPMTTDRR
jgi:NTE family protein